MYYKRKDEFDIEFKNIILVAFPVVSAERIEARPGWGKQSEI